MNKITTVKKPTIRTLQQKGSIIGYRDFQIIGKKVRVIYTEDDFWIKEREKAPALFVCTLLAEYKNLQKILTQLSKI